MGFLQPILLPIENVLFQILTWLHGFVGDWGVAIILLTLLVRVLLIPLTWKQTQSMYEMQKIQPQIKAIQEKYKNDKEKQNEELMKFYAEHKVNPLGGCLPVILQMPIFFALFGLLGNAAKNPSPYNLNAYLAKAGETANFLGIIPDISKTPQMVFMGHWSEGFFAALIAALPYLVLVVMFSLSIWIPQALMPGEKQQKMIGLYMAVFMLYFGWISPAGVLLYWVTSSIFGIAQQQITLKVMENRGAAPAMSSAGTDSKPQPIDTSSKSEKAAPAKKKQGKKK